ncbi:shTK domain protein [Dictyocaulus viviparus]|uniref:ShTK domain protein n=1 Tax=Dictyocaulus viviparus TaxID=29172 RepID=A0A0D8XV63_DICVI|nr:shTK domain protein [Dictyocaulus viviparus]
MHMLLINSLLLAFTIEAIGATTTTASMTTVTVNSTTSNSTTSPTTAIDKKCEDVLKNCSKYLSTICGNLAYRSLMKTKCAKTCKLCNVTCFDKAKKCSEWNSSGFCASNFYSNEVKMKYCAATCNLCEGDSKNTQKP